MQKLNKGLLLSLVLLCVKVYGQEIKDIVYPKGIYGTFEAYQAKIPTDIDTEFRVKLSKDSIKYRFYNVAIDKRLKKAFAFSNGKDLYVSAKYIYKHLNIKDRGKQLKDDGNYHLRAKKIGAHYHYYESYFTGTGAALWGGVIAAAASRRIKGVVYDIAHKEFNIFRNAKDFKRFLSKNHPNYLNVHKDVEENKGTEDLNMIRNFIAENY